MLKTYDRSAMKLMFLMPILQIMVVFALVLTQDSVCGMGEDLTYRLILDHVRISFLLISIHSMLRVT
jgi:hypothetical protein